MARLSQQEAAENTGFSKPSIQRWELGHHDPPIGYLRKLASLAGVSPAWFLQEESPPPEPPPINTKMPESTPAHLQKGRSRKGLLYPSDFPTEQQPEGSPVEQAMARIEAAQAELLAAQEALRQAIGRR